MNKAALIKQLEAIAFDVKLIRIQLEEEQEKTDLDLSDAIDEIGKAECELDWAIRDLSGE